MHNSEIFPKRPSFRFVRRKITHFTIETDASRAFVASSTGLAVQPYLLYNFSCVSYTFCRIRSIFEMWGFRGLRIFFFYYIISVSKHVFSGSPELRPNQNWLYPVEIYHGRSSSCEQPKYSVAELTVLQVEAHQTLYSTPLFPIYTMLKLLSLGSLEWCRPNDVFAHGSTCSYFFWLQCSQECFRVAFGPTPGGNLSTETNLIPIRLVIKKKVFFSDTQTHTNTIKATTTSHGTSRFVSERRFGMGCPSHLQVCFLSRNQPFL